jgi:hypothetical protein
VGGRNVPALWEGTFVQSGVQVTVQRGDHDLRMTACSNQIRFHTVICIDFSTLAEQKHFGVVCLYKSI